MFAFSWISIPVAFGDGHLFALELLTRARVRAKLHGVAHLLTHEGIGKPMSKRRQDLDQHMNAIEAKVPDLLQRPDTFPRAFEDEVEILLGQIAAQDQAYALEQLEAIVDRSSFNG